jgi:NDP-sugar pyrophosphorylase family protein
VHPTAVIDDNVTVGQGSKIWHFSHILSGSNVGEKCNLGQNVMVGPDVIIGNNCKLQNNVSVYEGVTLEDGVFCGPSMVFTNIYNPRAEIRKMDQVRKRSGLCHCRRKSGKANWLGLRMRRAADRRSGLPCLRQAVCKKSRWSGNPSLGVRCQPSEF